MQCHETRFLDPLTYARQTAPEYVWYVLNHTAQ